MFNTRHLMLIIFTLSVGFSLPALAASKPTKAQIKRDLKKENRKYTNIKVTSKGVKNYDSVGRIYRWSQWVETTVKQSKKVSMILTGEVEYHSKSGKGGWSFHRFWGAGGRYVGIPNPKEAELQKLIDANIDNFMRGQSTVVSFEKPKLAEAPQWEWHTENSVSMNFIIELEQSVSYTKLEKVKQQVRMRIYRDGVKKPWKSNLNTSFQRARNRDGTEQRVVLSEREITAEQMRALPNWRDRRAMEEAKELKASLPKLDLPAFTEAKILGDELYKVLFEGDAKKIQSFFLSTVDSSLYAPAAPGVLSQGATKMMDDVIKNVSSPLFKTLYCTTPRLDTKRTEGTAYVVKSIKIPPELGGAPTVFVRMKQSDGGYVNGKLTKGDWKLLIVEVGTKVHKNFEGYAKSLNDRTEVCAP